MIDVCSTGKKKRAEDYAVEYASYIDRIETILEEQGVQLTERFTGDSARAEIWRYADDILHVQSEAEKARIVQAAAKQIEATVEWNRTTDFVSPEDMKQKWGPYVYAVDPAMSNELRPILYVNFGAAVLALTDAELTQMPLAVLTCMNRIIDTRPAPEDVLVVANVQGATQFQVMYYLGTLKTSAVTLTVHFPSRLGTLYFVDVPPVLRGLYGVIAPVLHPETREKLVFCSAGDACLPGPPASA